MMRNPALVRRVRREPPLAHLLLALAGLVALTPFVWMLLTAFKAQHQIIVTGGVLPSPWVWSNFGEAWRAAPFGRYLLNSVLVTSGTVLLQLITACLAGFAFARLRFCGRELFFVLFLATMMIPPEVTLISDYLLLSRLRWLDTYQALIVPWGASPIAIFLLRQYLRGLPDELADAARIDGSGNWGFLWRVALPLAGPAIFAAAIFGAVGSWNDFTWPLIMTNSDAMRTAQIGISYFSQDAGVQYPLLMAASSFVILPMLLLFISMQKQFIQGIARSGLK